MSIDLSKIANTSITATLQDLGSIDGSTVVSGTLGASSTSTKTVTLVRPNTKSIGIYRVSVSGTVFTNLNDKWYIHQGLTRYFSNDGVSAPTYGIYVTTTFTSTTVSINFVFSNNTGSPVSLSGITIQAHGRFYTYPWAA